MKDHLAHIKKPIKTELEGFEEHFRNAMKSNVPLLDKIMFYIVKRKGKRVRPMFVFLSAKLHGQVTESSYTGASLIELLHTATIVHDDVVDDAFQRRGFFSINALWKNKIAVLVGDFLFSRGMLLALDNEEYHLLQIVSRAVKDMSEGELLQMEKARKLDIEEEIYFDIIRQKTASLIAAACGVGTASATSDTDRIEEMRQLGEHVGIAFQIKDDLLDYGDAKIGKPTGIDIKEKKLTLPLIYTLKNISAKERRHVLNTIKNHNTDKARVRKVIDLVHKTGGISYAEEAMTTYRAKALAILDKFADSEYKHAMQSLIDFVILRKS